MSGFKGEPRQTSELLNELDKATINGDQKLIECLKIELSERQTKDAIAKTAEAIQQAKRTNSLTIIVLVFSAISIFISLYGIIKG